MLLKWPYEAFRYGEIRGMKVTRNPIAWIPYFLALPFIIFGAIFFTVIIYPPLMVLMIIENRNLLRKEIDFDGEGVTFGKAYRKRQIRWEDIDSIEKVHGPNVASYKIFSSKHRAKPFIAIEFDREEDFEKFIDEFAVQFTNSGRFGRKESSDNISEMKQEGNGTNTSL